MTVYVVNSSNLGLSEYGGDTFVDVISIWGKVFLVTGTQLLELGASGTAAETLEAYVETGWQDHYSEKRKNIRHVLPRYVASNGLDITMTASGNGKERERSYSVDANAGPASKKGVVRVTNGIREQFWKTKIANRSGGTLELFGLEQEVRVSGRND